MSGFNTINIDESILEQFNLQPKAPEIQVNGMKLSEIIKYMERVSEKLIDKKDLYLNTDDESVKEDCIDIASEKLNQFTQAFMDVIKFIMIKEKSPLSKEDGLIKCIRVYRNLNDSIYFEENEFLNGLSLRNDLTHDYFNYVVHTDNLISLLVNYAKGSLQVCDFFTQYCEERGYIDEFVDKNLIRN